VVVVGSHGGNMNGNGNGNGNGSVTMVRSFRFVLGEGGSLGMGEEFA
jgi:hypothetical protein